MNTLARGTLIAIDPGREKTGMALIKSTDGGLLEKVIVPTEEVPAYCQKWLQKDRSVEIIVCGNGTNHAKVSNAVKEAVQSYGKNVVLTDEAHTTEEARRRYFEYNPPKGLKRLLPKGMLYPPEPVDDFTAWIIGERYLQKIHNHGK
ncbi:hypothetical protein [uncultured Veillonella sp.]|uniref:hypothetical protein n=1 Tax=uncultured Veillonella sp. TaxID=159268 RepID=UPI002603AAF7|nr:hypothetical protein [uncultured Veillonella sp.]